MQDSLEEYIRNHRDEFEDAVPDNKVWDRVGRDLQKEAAKDRQGHSAKFRHLSRSGKRWLSAAAIFLLCISFAAFIRTYQVKTQMMNAAIPRDLQEAQAYYENRITAKIDRIKAIESIRKDNADTSLWKLFGQHDEEYMRIKKALEENPGNAHVRSAFVEYYRSRLSVLNQIEQHLGTQDSTAKRTVIK